MLSEERYAAILQILTQQKTATVTQLAECLKVSESTIRRDLNTLDNAGRLCKVHGGATVSHNSYLTQEDDVLTKQDLHSREKELIGRCAAALIQPEDFVYIDAGTTTFRMLEHLATENVTYVTNGIQHAAKLAALGCRVYVPGGRIKGNTQAITGTEAIRSLNCYNFTKGFFGTNGISSAAGFSTPEFSEGNLKTAGFHRCQKRYVVADSSKFKRVFPVTFAKLAEADIITDMLPDPKYRKITNIIEAGDNA